jgi:hypothetical protein
MELQNEIDTKRREIATDGYAMSIGEAVNLYHDGELNVHPEFQRVYRWTDHQKSRLIESILLGIPLPSIFVAQNEEGIWEVVDGVQRISTILQFMGLLKDDEGALVAPLILQPTKFLPTLGGKKWEDENDPTNSLTGAQRIDIKRSKLDFKIIKRESDPSSKYDLFQRLNSYGSLLTQQEVRDCILISLNRDFYEWMRSLSNDANFVMTTALPERVVNERYDMELVLRFLIFRTLDTGRLGEITNLHDFLTDEMARLAVATEFNRKTEQAAFERTFELLANSADADSFRKYVAAKSRFQGGFSIAAFEVVAMGIGYHVGKLPTSLPYSIDERIRKFWESPQFQSGFSTGVAAADRLKGTLPYGRTHFAG